MQTRLLGTFEIDHQKLSQDLDVISHFDFDEPYIEFSCGYPWKSAMVWTSGGVLGDGVLSRYDNRQPCLPTANGRKLAYVREIIQNFFVVEHLLFARVVVMSNNVLVPHRDFLELEDKSKDEKVAHRLQVPLATSEDALFMEENVIYRMRVGEVWSLDATRLHSAAALTDHKRVHLILDFADTGKETRLVKFGEDRSAGIPDTNLAKRPALSAGDRDAILGMSKVIDMDNFKDILGIIIKKHYRNDAGEGFVWETMREISRLSGDPEIEAHANNLYEHYVLSRTD
ncbi:L-proline 3-hydroxylase, C-terminal [Amycolatopsis pretoriensis]|uniref:L-proline 3-hydroxylase, C-terminal n=1 Tax=Amycolatopsis pretoriensis TaxID=218821 RepID=A0A1H5QET4_9PSEU|nr:aspartyl/asparaginyl beta-hydroxylase domain-containing protein [Amycolatopsis pretoriensis]SEF24642.1 L-proline 3-hydroxylase, C-terminal [Amycolatopsis pretoriensis]